MNATIITAKQHCCEEASTMSGAFYIPCNKPARQIVLSDGQELRMCDECAWHSKKNRGMTIVREYGTGPDEVLIADVGANNPPDPLDEVLTPYGDALTEAENWLDGNAVENEGQMKAVDALLKQIKAAEKAVKDAEESEAKPIYDAWKAAKARYAPTLDDLTRIKKGLVAVVDAFKRKLAAEKAETERKARAEAEAARRAAEEAARKADAADLDAQRRAAEAMEAAKAAQAQAAAASKDTVKGLRTVTKYQITDHRKLLHWIAANDREEMTEFIEEYARRHHKGKAFAADGLRVWDEKEAF